MKEKVATLEKELKQVPALEAEVARLKGELEERDGVIDKYRVQLYDLEKANARLLGKKHKRGVVKKKQAAQRVLKEREAAKHAPATVKAAAARSKREAAWEKEKAAALAYLEKLEAAERRKSEQEAVDEERRLSPGLMQHDEDVAHEMPYELDLECIAQVFPTIPLAEVLQLQRSFTQADKDQNGTLDKEEVVGVLGALQLGAGEAVVLRVLEEMGLGDEGALDFLSCISAHLQLKAAPARGGGGKASTSQACAVQ